MPTVTSKRFIPKKDVVSLISMATMAIANAATIKIPTASFSTGYFSTKILKIDEPVIQQTMKVAKMRPNGRSPFGSSKNDFNNGVHMNTKILQIEETRNKANEDG
jgi:hypothetical protein